MTEFLYNVFLYQYQIGNIQLDYNKIKRLLIDNISEFQNPNVEISGFYNLLKIGLIDVSEKDKYCLTNSCIFTSTETKFSLGVNIPNAIIEKYKINVVNSYLGLTIFENILWDKDKIDFDIINFNLNQYTLGFHDISKVVKNWKFFNSDGIEKFSSMENYDFQTNKWGKTNKIIGDYSLFKIYEFNEYFYSYLFKYRNKYYKISSRETEKIRLIIISKSNKNLIKYDQKNNEIILEEYFNYPNFMYKTFFIEHILSLGKFPENNSFKIKSKDFLRIVKKLKLNYEII